MMCAKRRKKKCDRKCPDSYTADDTNGGERSAATADTKRTRSPQPRMRTVCACVDRMLGKPRNQRSEAIVRVIEHGCDIFSEGGGTIIV
jgi:hypothetical protein